MDTTKYVEYLVVDTTAFIQNASLQNISNNIITCPEVVNEVTNSRQLRRLAVLPYDLVVKEVFSENIKIVTDFSKKTGDYPSLSATDIKVMALTYQLEKEKVGTNHLRTEPILPRPMVTTTQAPDTKLDVVGFVVPGKSESIDTSKENKSQVNESGDILTSKLEELNCLDIQNDSDFTVDDSNILVEENIQEDDDDDDEGWITPSNVRAAKKQVASELLDEKKVTVACITTDFAMQNVLRQMNLNVAALDGRIIKQLRTYILRCYTCFKTTSIMTKKFCPKCGNSTLKKVSASLDENGKLLIFINTKRPLTTRGKKFSIPKIKGGKHPNNPILVEDQPMPHNRPSRKARTKTDALNEDYIAGFSPFAMRDTNSKSAQLCIRPGQDVKNGLGRNPNCARRRK